MRLEYYMIYQCFCDLVFKATPIASFRVWKFEKLIRSTKFPALDTCTRACTTMGVMGMLTSKEECPTCPNKVPIMPIRLFLCPICPNKAVTLVFGKSITVSREMLAYPLLSLLAEVDLCACIHF